MDSRKVVGAIADAVLDHRRKSVHDFRDRLIRDNQALGNPYYGFLYGGEFHTAYAPHQLKGFPKKILHPDLHTLGREYLQELKEFRDDDARLRQGLTMPIATSCKELQDVRDLLPEMVVRIVPELSELPRTRPPGWAFQDKPIHATSFQVLVDLLEYHTVIRIL